MNRPAPARPRRTLRCAIYTRKSTEEGLEQEFNSLHAQREACEAFIRSQRHEGWTVLPEHYDDGGYSGGTMDRPALQQLLADIAAGRVDLLVTYKIDRLTRSLADFAKIVEVFDQKDVSFVSVTQQFNTTTSMGRLTLNVLLSFAQFERELAGERVRDKIAASKKKGMWMGGVPPLGYGVQDRKLVVISNEAETVRHIFGRYAALGSVRLLQQELDAAGIRSKRWASAAGHSLGGKPLARGSLYLMLQNRIYRGETVHKDKSYPGEHAAIVDAALWEEVRAKLATNAVERGAGARARNPSLLAGLLFDADDQPMTPTHAVKAGRRYRYYISRPLVTGTRDKRPDGLRIPADEIEQVVTSEVHRLLRHRSRISALMASHLCSAADQSRALHGATEFAARWSNLGVAEMRAIVTRLIPRIVVRDAEVELCLSPSALAALLCNEPEVRSADEDLVPLSVPARLQRAAHGVALIIDTPERDGRAAKPAPKLIKLIARAHRLRDRLFDCGEIFLIQLAREEQLNRSYFTRIVQLSYLAPDITQAILDGRQPRGLTARTLLTRYLPVSWAEQRIALGFARPEAEPVEATL